MSKSGTGINLRAKPGKTKIVRGQGEVEEIRGPRAQKKICWRVELYLISFVVYLEPKTPEKLQT